MATRFIERSSDPTSAYADVAGNVAGIGVDSDSEELKFRDRTASVDRTAVTTDQTQTLTNKTLTAPSITAPTGFKETLHVPVSFETGFQMTLKLFFPYAVTINKIRGIVTKALAATDAGTVTAKNAASAAMANGVITFAASAALGNAGDGPVSPTTNNTIAADANIELVVAKATAGGEALISIEFTRS